MSIACPIHSFSQQRYRRPGCGFGANDFVNWLLAWKRVKDSSCSRRIYQVLFIGRVHSPLTVVANGHWSPENKSLPQNPSSPKHFSRLAGPTPHKQQTRGSTLNHLLVRPRSGPSTLASHRPIDQLAHNPGKSLIIEPGKYPPDQHPKLRPDYRFFASVASKSLLHQGP